MKGPVQIWFRAVEWIFAFSRTAVKNEALQKCIQFTQSNFRFAKFHSFVRFFIKFSSKGGIEDVGIISYEFPHFVDQDWAKVNTTSHSRRVSRKGNGWEVIVY